VEARSPGDVAAVVERYLKGLIDFSVIDATRTNDAIIADFAAVHAVSAANGIHLFHDVINRRMLPGFTRILDDYNLSGKIFPRTPSGMALAYTAISPEFSNYLDCFVGPLSVPEIASRFNSSWIKGIVPKFVKARLHKFRRSRQMDRITKDLGQSNA
jgi:hypothetical protein